jgi:hypothetical protein
MSDEYQIRGLVSNILDTTAVENTQFRVYGICMYMCGSLYFGFYYLNSILIYGQL